ncbi:hypothetical protein QBZ16_004666 [Prototheca wickerhamii]|uniref:Protein kinase domain-containing protein n=1 Tax=Prototheca wickerhamii TaxID=3111 RepID=A0AAD9IHS5_PROWI|nr:hypothetical protein QBZ16_004666 [Prototheca wickerhamii]
MEASALMAQARLIENSSAVLSSWNYPSSVPCDADFTGRSAWTGITCTSGMVTEINLASRGLKGQLSGELSLLEAVVAMYLQNNSFSGPLPAGWTFGQLRLIYLADNQLNGSLPEEWGDSAAFPMLALVLLENNDLGGQVPDTWWDSDAFHALGTAFVVRPGNPSLCGPVRGVADINGTQLEFLHRDLFEHGTAVLITNTLGPCLRRCSLDEAAVLSISTNFFDLAATAQLPLNDIAIYNPGIRNEVGEDVLLPCYVAGYAPPAMYSGANAAYRQFAGGHQIPADSPGGAASAGEVVRGRYRAIGDSHYVGSSNRYTGARTLPLWWFVDLVGPMQVAAVVIVANSDLESASIWAANDTTAIAAPGNARLAEGLALSSPDLLGVMAFNGSMDTTGQYLLLTSDAVTPSGAPSPDGFDLRHMQVYPTLGDAARNKPAALSDGSTTALVTDGDNGTCIVVPTNGRTGAAYAQVDLGYSALVALVGVVAGNIASQWTPSIFVTEQPTTDFFALPASAACGGGGLYVANESYTALPCFIRGRYVALAVPNQGQLHICQVAAYIGDEVILGPPDATSAQQDVALLVAVPIAALLGAVVVILVGAYFIVRRNYRRRKPGVAPPKFLPWLWLVCRAPLAGRQGAPARGAHALAANVTQRGQRHDPKHAAPSSASASPPASPRNPFTVSGSSLQDEQGSLGSLSKLELGAGGGPGPLTSSLGTNGGMSVQMSGVRVRTAQGSLEVGSTDLTKLPQGAAETLNVVDMAAVTLLRVIGEGSFGQVWLASYCETTVAVKMLVLRAAPTGGSEAGTGRLGSGTLETRMSSGRLALMQDDLQKEATIMARLRHPNCCQYLGICLDPPSLLMEYCAQRSVDTVLASARHDVRVAASLSWARLLSMAFDAAKGMLYLHTRSPPIVHRDLKSANLLLDSQWHVKVADFNLSRAMDAGQMMSTITVTNPRWLSPEILQGGPATMPSDVYAFGTLMWELLTWELPFANMNPYQIINLVHSAGPPGLTVPAPDQLAAGPLADYDEYVALMRACWALDTRQRPTMATVASRLKAMLRRELAAGPAAPSPFGPAPSSPSPSAALRARAPAGPFASVSSSGLDGEGALVSLPTPRSRRSGTQASAGSTLGGDVYSGQSGDATPGRSAGEATPGRSGSPPDAQSRQQASGTLETYGSDEPLTI